MSVRKFVIRKILSNRISRIPSAISDSFSNSNGNIKV